MFIDIQNELTTLTDGERDFLSRADFFTHANGVMIIHTSDGHDIYWTPNDAVQAYDYLKKYLKVREI